MKAKFLRHEYTWSKESIDGTFGLGIVSSSSPKDSGQLRELEKMASVAEPDSTGMEVEMLTYSSQTGFVKMAVKPVPADMDQRKNKKVFLYQCEQKDTLDPAVYSIPQGSWRPVGNVMLPEVTLAENWPDAKEILLKYQLVDRLPDLFRAVFWCIFRGSSSLAFVADWDKENYAAWSRQIMYALHSLIPDTLRKNAGYVSFSDQSLQSGNFYFTDKVPEDGDSYELATNTYRRKNMQDDKLDSFFYDTLAALYWQDEGKYFTFIKEVEREIREREINKNLLREIQWIFLEFCLQNMIDIPTIHDVMGLFPQLFYRCSESMSLEEVQNNLMQYYHMSTWKREDYDRYLGILENGITKKGEKLTLDEMEWTLTQYQKKHKKLVYDYLLHLKKHKKSIYTKLLTRNVKMEESPSNYYFKKNQETMDSMKKYVGEMEQKYLSEDFKDLCLIRGIEILNEDVFCVENFQELTRMSLWFNRKEQWINLLNGFLQQLREGCRELSDEQLEAANEIEMIYRELSGESGESMLIDEKTRRAGEDEEKEMKDKKEIVPIEEEKLEEEELYRSLDSQEEAQRGRFLPFLMRGIPYGFLTGCVLYLINYSLVIGHWKISVGAGGMWLIIMLNYLTSRMEKKKLDGYRTWMSLGLSIVEGYIIHIVAWMFLRQNVRVYFFLALGVLTVAVQIIEMVLVMKRNHQDEEEI